MEPCFAVVNYMTKTCGVSDTAEKFSNLTIGSGKLSAKSQQSLPMKAGGWHGQSDLILGRSQEMLSGRNFTRTVAG